jgi:hypothetical protein
MRDSGLPGHWVRVENRVGEGGTPDLNFAFTYTWQPGTKMAMAKTVEGWMELKSVEAWPTRDEGPLRVPHFERLQRVWLRAREASGGKSYLLLRVERSRMFLLLSGTYASIRLGTANREELMREAVDVLVGKFSPAWLTEGLIKGAQETPLTSGKSARKGRSR